MTQDRRQLFDQVDAAQAERARAEDDAVQRKARRRRTRREGRPARLRFIPGADGGTLIIPEGLWTRVSSWALAAYGIGASCIAVPEYLASTVVFSVFDYIWLAIIIGVAPFMCHLGAMFATRRIELLAGRGYVVRRRTFLGFLRVVESGKDPTVRLTYAHSGLLEGVWGNEKLLGLGEADVEVLKEACRRAQIPIELPTAEERERADHWVGRGIERHVILSMLGIFGGAIGTVALVYFSQKARLDQYAAPDLPQDAELAGLARSRGAESWGEWSIQPSKITAGGGDGSAGVTIAFAGGSPVRELRVKTDDPEHRSGYYLEWHFVGEGTPRIVRFGESCRRYNLESERCKNADGSLNADRRTRTRLRFECWTQGIDGTFISNCPKPTP